MTPEDFTQVADHLRAGGIPDLFMDIILAALDLAPVGLAAVDPEWKGLGRAVEKWKKRQT